MPKRTVTLRRNTQLGYCTGLMSPLSRKSVEPIAAHVDPLKVRSRHQSLHHFVADANWSDEQMLLRVCQWVVPLMDFSDSGWWIIDDTGFPKQGRHSVGVARQYCGMLGKQDNCQVAVSVSLACEAASVPVAWRLYLPKEWADDPARRDKAGVPEALQFATKPTIALRQLEHLLGQGAPRHCVLADAGYGVDTAFRERLSELGLRYVVGVTGSVTVWPPGREPLPPAASVARGHVGTRLRLGGAALPQHHPQSVKALAQELGPEHWHTVTWREGTNAKLRSRFARVRVRAAHRDNLRDEVREPEWLLIEWPKGDAEPLKYWLSTLPEDATLERMVFEAKMRWRIERDYQDLKQDLGLGHYEGRGWRGFHHHASLSICAYGFLLAQRLRHPDESGGKKTPLNAKRLHYPRITDLGEVLRAQRHVPSSITSLRIRIGALLARNLPRCPCCCRPWERQNKCGVEMWRGGRRSRHRCCRPFRLAVPYEPDRSSVSTSPSSNRTCAINASNVVDHI